MNYLLIVIAFLPYSSALVHYQKLEAGEKGGCKTKKGTALAVGAYEQDDEVCGVIQCQNNEGDALILYCQRPALFAQCGRDIDDMGVSTIIDFPQCCWICVRYVICAEAKKEEKPKEEKPKKAA